MSCHQWRSRLIELGRGRLPAIDERNLALEHTRGCADCRLFLEAQMALTAAASMLAAEPLLAAPSELESVLVAEFLSRHAMSRYRRLAMAAAIGVIAVALAWLVTMRRGHGTPVPIVAETSLPAPETARIQPVRGTTEAPPPKPVRKPARRSSPKAAAEEAPFVAIPYTVPLGPWERATVLRMEMPAAALAAVGLTVAAPDPLASAQTDVLVGQDGRIRAIRLLSLSPFSTGSSSNTDRSVNQ